MKTNRETSIRITTRKILSLLVFAAFLIPAYAKDHDQGGGNDGGGGGPQEKSHQPSHEGGQPAPQNDRQPEHQQAEHRSAKHDQPAQRQEQPRPNSPKHSQQRSEPKQNQPGHESRKSQSAPERQKSHKWEKQRGWQKQGAWHGSPNWKGGRAHNWQSEHRTWSQRGGYGGYRISQVSFGIYFGQEHAFRIESRPVMYEGYPRFSHGGSSFIIVDPWPETWHDDWYESDDVYIGYDDGYYLYNREYPDDAVAIMVID